MGPPSITFSRFGTLCVCIFFTSASSFFSPSVRPSVCATILPLDCFHLSTFSGSLPSFLQPLYFFFPSSALLPTTATGREYTYLSFCKSLLNPLLWLARGKERKLRDCLAVARRHQSFFFRISYLNVSELCILVSNFRLGPLHVPTDPSSMQRRRRRERRV